MIKDKTKGSSALEGKGFLLRNLKQRDEGQEDDRTVSAPGTLIHITLHRPHRTMSGSVTQPALRVEKMAAFLTSRNKVGMDLEFH